MLILIFLLLSIMPQETITIDDREFYIHTPTEYDEEVDYPLVIVLHGAGGDMMNMANFTGMTDLADENGFIAAFPNAIDNRWSYLDVPIDENDQNANDVQFISDMIDWIDENYSMDANRVYVMGFSNGGLMTTRLRCSLTDKIAAVAVIGATMTFGLSQQCLDAEPMPYLLSIGTQDGAFPWNGILEVDNGIMYGSLSVSQTISFMQSINHCSNQEDAESIALRQSPVGVMQQPYSGCDAETVLYALIDFGHNWPSSPIAVTLEDGESGTMEQRIWEFFERQPN